MNPHIKQMVTRTNWMSFLCRNNSRHHNGKQNT